VALAQNWPEVEILGVVSLSRRECSAKLFVPDGFLLGIIVSMTRKKKSKRSNRKSNANVKLAALFKMSREELAARKTTGGGTHKTRKDVPRPEQKRRAVEDHLLK
jgi:hypothetical protein